MPQTRPRGIDAARGNANTLRHGPYRSYAARMTQSVITRDFEIMGGAPVFSGTRVPVQTLLDYLEAGDSIDESLAGFPSVTRGQVIAFLETAKDRLVESVS